MSGTADRLEDVFGAESDDAFGSAVFRRDVPLGGDLEGTARAVYRDFVGEVWDRFGASTWLGEWSELVSRETPDGPSVLKLLSALDDPQARSAADVLVTGSVDPDAAKHALEAAFDRPAVSELTIYRIGDGDAMSGLLIAAREHATSAATFLVFLMD